MSPQSATHTHTESEIGPSLYVAPKFMQLRNHPKNTPCKSTLPCMHGPHQHELGKLYVLQKYTPGARPTGSMKMPSESYKAQGTHTNPNKPRKG